MPDRLEQLQAMLQKEPNDPFLLYGLGMEYKKRGNHPAAIENFQKTLTADPGYCYAYFQMGQVYELMGDKESAVSTYRQGIEAAKQKGDFHAAEEIVAALESVSG